jgi:glucose-6-phosphate isomerase
MKEKLTNLPIWHDLKAHHQHIADQTMQAWFAEDSARFSRFSLQVGEIFLDYSKNRITDETIQLLSTLAKAVNLPEKIAALFHGEAVNKTENRPALHTALRQQQSTPIYVKKQNIFPLIQDNLLKMRKFTEQVRAGDWRGSTGKVITDIVNIGIGGSHLGPLLTTCALSQYADKKLQCHFISNVDSAHILEVLQKLNPETTLFIYSSKSFTTLETHTNALTIKQWLADKNITAINNHFVAVTACPDKALAFGIDKENIFPMWDWVGGRYSIWSAIGLPLALLIGMDQFMQFLAGANAMDQHFRTADISKNMPILLALLGIWYCNFFAANNHAIIPYTHHLNHLRTYLQQVDMESNGKSVSLQGNDIDYTTGPIIWGEQGCNAQHAFHQLLHQGKHFIPVDFILIGKDNNEIPCHHDILVASGLSQAQALLQGKSYQQALSEVENTGLTADEIDFLAKHKSIPGNRPSNVLFLTQLNPYNLGALLALYEHKIFVQGAVWNINSFDQWGVELGKQLLPNIYADLNSTHKSLHDASTLGLISHYKNLREKL